ncbi:hypothetical protein CBR_g23318 [Chara braunii]|uniref:Reverse transcriptase domain-containing protein n=1 Tax=Chara braunii TaxID=69332 RepID=A0A388L3W5_CHABU|nr:hypothetical protein CBR_g23318 [Chara braunii]|eukprot:GBG76987.1 hypothetical protein CBR_g23318 [Chara braunii]
MGYRPAVATGANAEPILAWPAAGTVASTNVATAPAETSYGAAPRTGWWTRNQQILDKCNAFVSKAQQKEREEFEAKDAERKKREKEEEVALRKKEREELENSMEVELLKQKRADAKAKRIEAEAELQKLKEQMGRLTTEVGGGSTPRGQGTNLKEKMDEAARTGLRTGRKGKVKMTAGRLPRPDGSAQKANDRFILLQDERKRLKGLKKAALETLCEEEGLRYKTIEATAEELAQLYLIRMFDQEGEKKDVGDTERRCGKQAVEEGDVGMNFNLKSMAELAPALKQINRQLKKGEFFVNAAFDIKEMFCNLPHKSIMKAVRWVVDFWAIRGCKGVMVKTRGKGAKLRFGRTEVGWNSISLDMVVSFVSFELDATYFKVCGQVLQQVVGIPMGKASSPALACLLCTYNEFMFLTSLGCDQQLVSGLRMVDDVSVMIRCKVEDVCSLPKAREIMDAFRTCYDDNLVLEQTNGSDCWDFLGCVIKALDWPWGLQCVALHKNQRSYKEKGVKFQNLQDFDSYSSKQQKMAIIGSCLHRARMYTTMSGMEVAFLLTLKIELRKRGFPDEYFDHRLMAFSRKFGGVWDDWVGVLTGWRKPMLGNVRAQGLGGGLRDLGAKAGAGIEPLKVEKAGSRDCVSTRESGLSEA